MGAKINWAEDDFVLFEDKGFKLKGCLQFGAVEDLFRLQGAGGKQSTVTMRTDHHRCISYHPKP